MKLKQIIIQNFRCYKDEVRVNVDDFTTILGKNDIGKSTIFEALEIFFNNRLITLDATDLSKGSTSQKIIIGCVFTDLPAHIIIDETVTTTLDDEYLLNAEGDLEIHKIFTCSGAKPKEAVFAQAMHPTAVGFLDLLSLKITKLRDKYTELKINSSMTDLRVSSSIRKAIWSSCENLQLGPTLIPLDEEDAKRVWETLQTQLPLFALFQSDRPSKDDDSEVQDPMKAAIQEAIRLNQPLLEEIKNAVQNSTIEVATRTLVKIKEMDPALASTLTPNFRTEPKWDQIFKMVLTGDNDIPLNKRGSGVRRLILLNFFRAEAERRREQENLPGLIYAIEEPETSQHPSYQKMIMEALLELSQDGCQILITSHNPLLTSLVPVESIRYITKTSGQPAIQSKNADILSQVTNELGILPDSRVQLLICVEGPNDVNFLRHVSKIYHNYDNKFIDLSSDPRVALFPLGGTNLEQWVKERYLKNIGKPEFHIYDKGIDKEPKFKKTADQVNSRGDRSYATLTSKREMENYLHPDAIYEVLKIRIDFGDNDSVPEIAASAIHQASPDHTNSWDKLEKEIQKEKITRVKKHLNDGVAQVMTYDLIQEADPNGDIRRWLENISTIVDGNPV